MHVAGPEDVSSTVNRLTAFDETPRAVGLTGPHEFADRHIEEGGYRLTLQLLEQHAETTAVVAANGRLALGVIDAIRETGRVCPDDVSVVGFNDMLYGDRFSPTLTTVRISHYDLGSKAASLLLDTIADPSRPTETRLIASELMIRGSTSAVST